jgi:hypothetical protein
MRSSLRTEGQKIGAYKSTEADALRRVKVPTKKRQPIWQNRPTQMLN